MSTELTDYDGAGLMQGREDGDVLAIQSGVIATQHRAEIDMQISTAKKYPRSIHASVQNAITMATIDVATAASCFYKIPRDGKMIEGPSVRLAEIFCSAWGNMRFGGRVIDEDDRFITSQGVAHDLQTNNATTIEVRRRITNKYGKKFNDDMVAVTGNAATSIALRNAVFRIIPRSYVDQVYRQAKKVAIGDVKTLSERRTALVGYITGKIGIPLSRVLGVINRAHEDDIDLNDLETLYGLSTAVRDGEITPEAAFPVTQEQAAVDPSKSKAANLAEKIKSKAAIEQPKAEPVSTPESSTQADPKKDESGKSEKSAQSESITAADLEDWDTADNLMRERAKDLGILRAMYVTARTKALGLVPKDSTPEKRYEFFKMIVEGRIDPKTGAIAEKV